MIRVHERIGGDYAKSAQVAQGKIGQHWPVADAGSRSNADGMPLSVCGCSRASDPLFIHE
jgi:hypothetical protein